MLDQLEDASGVGEPGQGALRALTREALVKLAADELVEIGSHTVSHPMLTSLGTDEQLDEIRRSKAELEGLLGTSVTTFSYPNGDFTGETEVIVQESGYQAAFASHNDVLRSVTDRYRIPRFWVRNTGEAEFARWLRRWLS